MQQTRPPLKSLDEALAQLLAFARPLDATETISTFDADGCVLARDVVSALRVPPQDNSAMDGYAVRCADVRQPDSVLGVRREGVLSHPNPHPQPRSRVGLEPATMRCALQVDR